MSTFRPFACVVGIALLLAVNAFAQYVGGGGSPGSGSPGGGMPGGGSSGGGSPMSGMPGGSPGGSAPSAASGLHNTYHIGFDRPEAWGLKYFASTTLLSGLEPAEPPESRAIGSVTLGLETGWLPQLDAGQQRIGFNGTAPEDLNKAPVLIRPVLRVGLPAKFTAIAAAPLPVEVFGVTPRLLALGLERPLFEQERWTLTWRGYGQVGSVDGAFTCPRSVLAFAPGSAQNSRACVGVSDDTASLRYLGSEFQFAYRIPGKPKLVPHAAVGGNFIDGVFQVHAPVQAGLDQTRLWTHGGTFSTSGGVSYLISPRVALTVDAFYTPLWVQRSPTGPTTNDGLFNVRALISYSFR